MAGERQRCAFATNAATFTLSADEEANVMSLLSNDEVARIGRFHFEIDRKVRDNESLWCCSDARGRCARRFYS